MDQKFGVVLVAGLTFFGLILILDEGVMDFAEPSEQEVYYQESFGKIGESVPDHRTISLGDFTAGEGRGEILGFQQDRASISDRVFRGNTLEFEYNATQPQDGKITFEVLGRDGSGSVFVDVNGERIFDEHMVATSTPEITVPEENFRHGINSFRVGVNRDGFFSSSEYVIEDVELRVSDRKFHEHRDSFQVHTYEMEDHLDTSLSFTISDSVKTEPLRITVNGGEIYNREQVRTQEDIDIDIEHLRTGTNSIRFSTDRSARYGLENTDITMRYLGSVESDEVFTSFGMNSSQLSYVGRSDTEEYLSFEYRSLLPTTRSLDIQINGYNRTVEPRNGVNRYSLPEGTLQDENTLLIQSEGAYILENLQIGSERAM